MPVNVRREIMSNAEPKFRSTKQMIDAIKAARDAAQLRLHLLSLEAKERWLALETKLIGIESKLEQEGEKVAATAAAAVQDLTQAVTTLLNEQDGSSELATTARKVMKQAPASCLPDDTLTQAAEIMWQADCGAIPVVNAEGKLVGIITDRDICMATHTRAKPPADISVQSTMSKDVVFATPEDSLAHVARLMGQKQVRRIPIVEDGRLVGMVALADLARHIRSAEGNSLPACRTLVHTIASLSERRTNTDGNA
jgi:CBS domain-containing protein